MANQASYGLQTAIGASSPSRGGCQNHRMILPFAPTIVCSVNVEPLWFVGE